MSDVQFLKCSCRQCGGHIEFPAKGAGLTVDCPHCGQKTLLAVEVASRLQAAAPPDDHAELDPTPNAPAPTPRRLGKIAVIAAVVVLLGASGFGFWFVKNRAGKDSTTGNAPAATTPPAPSDPSADIASPAGTPPAAASTPKSLDDFKIVNVTLEKGKGTSLVHAVGALKNASDHQRFGIKLELDLLDDQGNKVGTAKDYRAVLEPREAWRFRALVLDNRATSARFASVEEDQ
jgi:hypothetical protein